MAQGLLTAITDIGSGLFLIIFSSSIVFWASNELDCEYVSLHLMTLGLLIATTSTSNGFFVCWYYFLQLHFELWMSLIVSMWTHSSWF